MASNEATPVAVTILGKEYHIACTPEERDALLESARFLDARMRDIRDRGKVIGSDRIAVMAALNITHDLLKIQNRKEYLDSTLTNRVRAIQGKIEAALNAGRQFEI